MQVILLPQYPFSSVYNRVHDISKFFSLNDITTYVINPQKMASNQICQTMYKNVYDVILNYSIDLETRYPYGFGADKIKDSIIKLYDKIYENDKEITLIFDNNKWGKIIKYLIEDDPNIKFYNDTTNEELSSFLCSVGSHHSYNKINIGNLVDFKLFNSYLTNKKTFKKVGYYGNITKDINFNMLRELAKNNKDFIIDIVGRVDDDCAEEFNNMPSNIRLFWKVSRKYVGDIMKYWSAGIKFDNNLDVFPYYCLGLKDIYIGTGNIELQYLLDLSTANVNKRIGIAKEHDLRNNKILKNLIGE